MHIHSGKAPSTEHSPSVPSHPKPPLPLLMPSSRCLLANSAGSPRGGVGGGSASPPTGTRTRSLLAEGSPGSSPPAAPCPARAPLDGGGRGKDRDPAAASSSLHQGTNTALIAASLRKLPLFQSKAGGTSKGFFLGNAVAVNLQRGAKVTALGAATEGGGWGGGCF